MDFRNLLHQSVGIGFALMFMVGCTAQTPTPVPLTATPLSAAEGKRHYDVRVRGGNSAEAIIAVYGGAATDYMDPGFRPAVIRYMEYPALGLKFRLNRDRVYGISVSEPYDGEIFALRIGDNVSKGIALYGPYERDEMFTAFFAVVWKAQLPNWQFVLTETGIITNINYFDQSIFGNWIG